MNRENPDNPFAIGRGWDVPRGFCFLHCEPISIRLAASPLQQISTSVGTEHNKTERARERGEIDVHHS
ncbi:hypothetical protein EPR50_G00104870 [Perca flavescens]|uniref:Uncharacterized protein n=1 Tax=Perca flavescens TaxID=8167 RepID=A0A484CWL1_PERFV|nr:hypothetical protein EPR50_G00104870 [Perca flavescens]